MELIGTKTRQEILKIQKDYALHDNIELYISECARVLLTDLDIFFDKKVIYLDIFTLQFGTDNFQSLTDFNADFLTTNFDDDIVKNYEFGKDSIKKDNTLSLTRLMRDNELHGFFISNDSKSIYTFEDKIDDCFCFELDKIKINKSLLEFYSVNQKIFDQAKKTAIFDETEIDEILEKTSINLNKFQREKLKNNFLLFHLYFFQKYKYHYSYFVRPRVARNNLYNGSLHIVLEEPLKISEFNILSSLMTDILSETAMSRMENLVKDVEWKTIAQYRSHALHHQNLARKGIKRNLEDAFNGNDKEKFDTYMAKLNAIDGYVKDLDEMEYALHKVDYSKLNYEKLAQNDKVRSILEHDKVGLVQIFENCLDTMLFSLDRIKFAGDENHKDLTAKMIEALKIKIKIDFDFIQINSIRSMFEVIFQDMIKNAIRHTNPINPIIELTLKDHVEFDKIHPSVKNLLELEILKAIESNIPNAEKLSYYTLVLTNNASISSDKFELLLTGNMNYEEKDFSLGVKTIHRLLKYDGIGKSGCLWFYTPSLECIGNEEETKTLLLIPNLDFI